MILVGGTHIKVSNKIIINKQYYRRVILFALKVLKLTK
jgi:hypothetical protein